MDLTHCAVRLHAHHSYLPLIPLKIELECLRHLRELRADGNNVDSIDGLQKMDGLVKLSLQRNKIRSIDLAACRW